MNYLFQEYDEGDVEIIKKQLAIDSVMISGVVDRCKWDVPSIILTYPRRVDEKGNDIDLDYKTVSNLLWLTCPYLNRKIHDLESRGFIKKIEAYILDNRELKSKMKYAHAHYFYLRKKVYRHFLGDVTSIEENKRVFNAGIGGVEDTDNIKCLHLHYSHFRICEENYAGRITGILLNGDIYCKEGFCKNESQ